MFPQCCRSCWWCVRVCNFSMQTDRRFSSCRLSILIEGFRFVYFSFFLLLIFLLVRCHRRTRSECVNSPVRSSKTMNWIEAMRRCDVFMRDERGSLCSVQRLFAPKAAKQRVMQRNLRRQLNQQKLHIVFWSFDVFVSTLQWVYSQASTWFYQFSSWFHGFIESANQFVRYKEFILNLKLVMIRRVRVLSWDSVTSHQSVSCYLCHENDKLKSNQVLLMNSRLDRCAAIR